MGILHYLRMMQDVMIITKKLENMNEMLYESVIRSVFQCGRGPRFGADADIFRGLERFSMSRAEKPYEYGLLMGKVIAHLETALYEIKERYKHNQAFCSKIDYCLKYFMEPAMEKIDKCLEDVAAAFKDIHIIVTD